MTLPEGALALPTGEAFEPLVGAPPAPFGLEPFVLLLLEFPVAPEFATTETELALALAPADNKDPIAIARG